MARVVVTGIGMVTPLGNDWPTTWKSLIAGESGVRTITLFNAEGYDARIAAEVKEFDPSQYLPAKEARTTPRYIQFALAAAKQAVENAHLQITPQGAGEVAVCIASAFGGIGTAWEQAKVLIERGPSRVSPFLVPSMSSDMASAQVSIALGAKGPSFAPVASAATGAVAVGEAAELIRQEKVQVAIAGGAEACINPLAFAGFVQLGALSTKRNHEPTKASRPFDAERDGFVMGEGAVVLVLESLKHAQARHAPILAELAGYATTSDAFHLTRPAPEGEQVARAIREALKKADVAPRNLGYVNAHGTSTPLNDPTETRAIKSALGKWAYDVPISSTKSMTGHLLGGAGALEAAICVLAIQHEIVPPTINLEHPDPECDLDYTPTVARRRRVKAALSNSFGFGGRNAVLVFKEFHRRGEILRRMIRRGEHHDFPIHEQPAARATAPESSTGATLPKTGTSASTTP